MTIQLPGAERPLPDAGRRARREAVVREHMTSEMAGDLDACLATMPDGANYRIVPMGREHDGDLRLVPQLVHHAADAVIVEGRTIGTQHRDWAGIPSSGRVMDVEGAVIFRFAGDRLINETVYYDHAAVIRQLNGED